MLLTAGHQPRVKNSICEYADQDYSLFVICLLVVCCICNKLGWRAGLGNAIVLYNFILFGLGPGSWSGDLGCGSWDHGSWVWGLWVQQQITVILIAGQSYSSPTI